MVLRHLFRKQIGRWFERKTGDVLESAFVELGHALRADRHCSKCQQTITGPCYYAVVRFKEKPYCEACLKKLGSRVKRVREHRPIK